MRVCFVLAVLAMVAFVGQSAARRPLIPPVRAWRHGEINAETFAHGMGDLTGAEGSSDVKVGPFGTLGTISHAAAGVGTGLTGAESGGRIDSFSGHGSSSVGTSAIAGAFGEHSFSRTEGAAQSFNGFSQTGASSAAGAEGLGASAAKTGAFVSTTRYKRKAGRRHRNRKGRPHTQPRYIGGYIDAQTNAGGVGDITSAIGASNVEVDPYGSRGSVFHGAEGVGYGTTGARSGGTIATGNAFGVREVGSAARADAFGNLGSYSRTGGEAETINGFGRSRASSTAGARGFGASLARTGALAFN